MNLNELAKIITNRGGRAFLVGGAVLDQLAGRDPKDLDVEVFGLTLMEIVGILNANGLRADLVGAGFGIVKTVLGDDDIDLSIPRRENRIGRGHKDFAVECDPNMTAAEAGARRDLTINAMSIDLLTGELVDPFNGLADLRAGVLRATSPDTFREDALRVLRIAQLLPRKGNTVDQDTVTLCREMVEAGELDHLPRERVLAEFEKLLLKAQKPSTGFEFLRSVGALERHFPELHALVGCPQNPEHHPEGDVFVHTMMVLDNAAQVRETLPESERFAFMLAALCHDLGKPATTDRETLTAYGHEGAGVEPTRSFLARLVNSPELVDLVVSLVEAHMTPFELHRSNSSRGAYRRLCNKTNARLLAQLCRCDSAGKTGRSLDDPHPSSEKLLEVVAELGEAPKFAPVVFGRDLLAKGYTPGPELGRLLREAFELQMEGLSREEILRKF